MLQVFLVNWCCRRCFIWYYRRRLSGPHSANGLCIPRTFLVIECWRNDPFPLFILDVDSGSTIFLSTISVLGTPTGKGTGHQHDRCALLRLKSGWNWFCVMARCQHSSTEPSAQKKTSSLPPSSSPPTTTTMATTNRNQRNHRTSVMERLGPCSKTTSQTEKMRGMTWQHITGRGYGMRSTKDLMHILPGVSDPFHFLCDLNASMLLYSNQHVMSPTMMQWQRNSWYLLPWWQPLAGFCKHKFP